MRSKALDLNMSSAILVYRFFFSFVQKFWIKYKDFTIRKIRHYMTLTNFFVVVKYNLINLSNLIKKINLNPQQTFLY